MGPAQAAGGGDGASGGERAAVAQLAPRPALIPWVLGLTLGAGAAEWRAATGGEINADSHGIADFAVRDGPWSIALLTDTVDGRWTVEGDRGKGWVGLRTCLFAAGLQISPWTDGAPDPGRSLAVGYAGPEYGVQRFLGRGWYVGAQGHGRAVWYGALPRTEVAIPAARTVFLGEGVVGWWTAPAAVQLRPGAHLAPGSPQAELQPQLLAEARWTPGWTVHPRVELRAGVAEGQDDLTRTRLGGLNPYVVPLAGAAWAEWWVEDFAAARLGPELALGQSSVALLGDAAAFDGQTAAGFAVDSQVRWRRAFVDLDLGYAPWIQRSAGVGRLSVWFALGVDWGSFRSKGAAIPAGGDAG